MLFNKRVIIALVILIILGLIFGGLILSARKRVKEREARIRAAAERKFEEVKVTIVEGLTNQDVYTSLSKQGLGNIEDFVKAEQAVDTKQYWVLEDKPAKTDLQGFLFPDTYRFNKQAVADDVIAQLLKTFEQKFEKASSGIEPTGGYYVFPGFEALKLNGRSTSGLTIYEVVTLASIIEKETGKPGESASAERLQKERQAVASIFMNRLKAGMPLQSDATINFVTKSGRARSTYADLEVESPYNTYKYTGLPPGPIANVSYASLYAALHPLQSDYYYFLHDSTGEVYYAKTLEEHNANRRKYLK